MTTATPTTPKRRFFGPQWLDASFKRGTMIFALVVPALIVMLTALLLRDALPAFGKFGHRFLTVSIWDPVKQHYGILFAIYGTVVSSLLALLIAVPISLGAALFLSELAPRWLREPVAFMVELLAAVPSIVYGLWGIFVLIPIIQRFELWAFMAGLDRFPLLSGPPIGVGMLAAGVVLAIMIIPHITAVSREVIRAVPMTQREAAYALGCTHWEAMSGPVLRYARSGILGAIILGLGRALGETMAVTMVIGNVVTISPSLFSPAYTLPSLLANEFNEATSRYHLGSLVAAALVLLVITFIVNGIARLLIWKVANGARQEVVA